MKKQIIEFVISILEKNSITQGLDYATDQKIPYFGFAFSKGQKNLIDMFFRTREEQSSPVKVLKGFINLEYFDREAKSDIDYLTRLEEKYVYRRMLSKPYLLSEGEKEMMGLFPKEFFEHFKRRLIF